MRNELRVASGTGLQLHGASHGSGIYVSPWTGTSLGYSGARYIYQAKHNTEEDR